MAQMISFETKWLIFWHFFVIVNAIRYPEDRCNNNDCSTQLRPFQNASCLMIHNTTDCVQYLSSFTKATDIFLESEAAAKFSVSISPYTAQRYMNGSFWDVSAVNISFTIYKEDVDGLAIKIKRLNVTKCRFFDFRDQRRIFSLPVNFFYDCFCCLVEYNLQNVQMDVISLPSNERLSYYVNIPPTKLKKKPCDWQPVIMVFRGSLTKGVVKVKFSRPPSQFLISSSTVELVDDSTNEIINKTVSTNKMEDMLVTEFLSVPNGHYKVIVKPDLENSLGTATQVFQVQYFKPVLDIITLVCICIIIVFIICSFLVYRFCYISHKLSLTVKRALLVHSYDNPHHEDFVNAFVDFLNQTSNLKVNTIYGSKSQSSMDYLIEECSKADLIIFLISQGLLITLDEHDNRQIVPGHNWPTQLKDASNHIFYKFYYNEDFRQKKRCKIRFPYAKNLKIPDYIEKRTGECFNLPKDYKSCMSFLHGINTTILSNMFCPLFVIEFNSPEVAEKLKLVPVADENNDVVHFVSKGKMANSESQISYKEGIVESYGVSSFNDSEFTEGGSVNSTTNFEGSSDEISSEGEDQPLFDGSRPGNEGDVTESDEFHTRDK